MILYIVGLYVFIVLFFINTWVAVLVQEPSHGDRCAHSATKTTCGATYNLRGGVMRLPMRVRRSEFRLAVRCGRCARRHTHSPPSSPGGVVQPDRIRDTYVVERLVPGCP